DVLAPLYGMLPLGFFYERVYCRVTALNCEEAQTDLPLLRLAPPPENSDGQIVVWGAQDTTAAAWSPDYGDFWANIFPRGNIIDFALESNTILYFLDWAGLVQKMPYTGTAWSSAEPSVDTGDTQHMIAVQAEGKVFVAANAAATYPGAASTDGGATFDTFFQLLPTAGGNNHIAIDTNFDGNSTFFLADDNAAGTVYRNRWLGYLADNWADNDMMSVLNGAVGSGIGVPHATGQYGLQVAWTGAD
ncbi:unnamed protein product, partial [marine sediment metagenome]